MKPETLETVIRHLKGIVAALEKEKNPILAFMDCGLVGEEYLSVWVLKDGRSFFIKTQKNDVDNSDTPAVKRLESEITQMSEYVARPLIESFIDERLEKVFK